MTDPKSAPEIPGGSGRSLEIPGDPGKSQEISQKAYTICGEGSCKLHGGSTPIRTGRYSVVTRERVKELIAGFEADPNPLDMTSELAACRAPYQDYIERYDEFTEALIAWHKSYDGDAPTVKPRQILEMADAQRLLAEVTRMVKRIEDVGAASAISRANFYRVMTEMGRAVHPGPHQAPGDLGGFHRWIRHLS